MDTGEKPYWSALLNAADIDRALAKRVLYRWIIGEHNSLSTLAGQPAEALREALPELDTEESVRWVSALAGAEDARRELARLQAQGIDVITRADPSYPENLAERLPERWLPYLLYYRGNLDLLDLPAVYVAGVEAGAPQATEWAEALARRLATLPVALLGGYTQGIDRQALSASAASGGTTVLVLPLGMSHAGPILRAGQKVVSQRQRLELSPFSPDAEYTPALGRARTLLTTALADSIVLVEPDAEPADWPGLTELTGHGGAVFVWAPGGSEKATHWQAAGATPVVAVTDAESHIVRHLGLSLDTEDAEPSVMQDGTADAPPVRFDDADSAIDLLRRTGRVPDSLARRLRDAEQSGRLGEDEE
jgi:predicted Rossmann fold nucleotide-binding protein DprA/Smf involved in DNA uptake